jgi:hypothetical protein
VFAGQQKPNQADPQDSDETINQGMDNKVGKKFLLDQGGVNSVFPMRRKTRKSSKRQTVVSNKRQEFEENQKRLEREWQNNNAISGQLADKLQQATQGLLKENATESLFKKVEEKVESKRQLKSTIALFLILLLVNLTNILFLVGLNVLLNHTITKYTLFLQGTIYMSDNMLSHRRFYSNLLMEVALTNGLISNSRYQGVATMTGYSSYQVLSEYLRAQRKHNFDKIVNTSALLSTQAESNPIMESFYYGESNYTVLELLTDVDQIVANWSFVSGMVFKLTNLVVDLQTQLEAAGSALNKANLIEPTPKQQYLSYLSNYLRTNRLRASAGFSHNQLDSFVASMDYVPYMIYGLVGIIMLMLLLTITSFVFVLQQFEKIHKSFAFLSLRDAQERLAQLKIVGFQMSNIELNQYYYVEVLEERYIMSADELDPVSKTSVLPTVSKQSRQIFGKIRFSVALISFFYLLLAGICFAGAFLFSSRVQMVKWYHEKVQLSEILANNYLEYMNDIKTWLIIGNTLQYQLQSSTTYFNNFDMKINQDLSRGNDLSADSSKYRDTEDPALASYLRALFTTDICSLVSPVVTEICGRLDSEYTSKGLSQITARLSSFYKQTYVHYVSGFSSPALILNDPSFIQVELAAESIYFPLMFDVYDKLVSAANSYLLGSFSTTGLVFSLLYLLAMLLFTAFSSLPYLSVLRQVRVVNFSFLLLSLNTYLRNVQLRQLMQEYLHLKYY